MPDVVQIRRTVKTPRGGNIYWYSDVFFILQFFKTIPVNQFSRTLAQKMQAGVRKTISGMRNV